LQRGLDRKFSDLPVAPLRQPVRQQIVGWVEPFPKPIAVVRNMMGIASLHPSYALIIAMTIIFMIAPIHSDVTPLAEINNAFELMKRGESIRGVVTF